MRRLIFFQLIIVQVDGSFYGALEVHKLCDLNSFQILQFIQLYKDRVKTLEQLADVIKGLEQIPQKFPADAVEKWITSGTSEHIDQIIKELSELDNAVFAKDSVTEILKNFAKEKGIKFPFIAQPIRLALTGTTESPGVFDLLVVFGKEASLERLEKFLKSIKK